MHREKQPSRNIVRLISEIVLNFVLTWPGSAMGATMQRLLSAVTILAVVLFGASASAADYARATKHGAVDLSIGCPRGSTWDPRGGGTCRACPAGTKMVLFECRKATPPVAERALYVYSRSTILQGCRRGTFPAGLTTKCYRCRRGLSHNGALPVEVPGVCFKLPTIRNFPSKVVARVTPGQLLDPKRLARDAQTKGCAGYGKKAFFDLVEFGSCWSCPASHPRRTIYPVYGPNACATAACGKYGGRPCYVWERIPSCDKGLLEDPFSNRCVKPKDFACRGAMVGVNAVMGVAREAQKAGKALNLDALKKIPGVAEAMRFVENQTEHAKRQLAKSVEALPTDKVIQQLKTAIPTPEAAEKINRVIAALAKRSAAIQAAMLSANEICGGNPVTLRRLFREAFAEAGVLPPYDGGRMWGELMGVGEAHAAGFPQGWTFGLTIAPVLNVPLGGYRLPVQLMGVQVAVKIGANGEPATVSGYLTFGLDIVDTKIDLQELGAVETFISAAWPSSSCQPSAVGAGLVLGDAIGVGFNCSGVSSVSVKIGAGSAQRRPPTIVITDVAGDVTDTQKARRFSTKGPSVAKQVTFGPNFVVPLFGDTGTPSFSQ